MSPCRKIGMLQPSIAIVERDPAIESLMDLHGGSGKAEAAGLRMNLQPLAAPLHDVVVADDVLVSEAADAIEIFRSRTPGFLRLAGRAREAAVVVGEEASQDEARREMGPRFFDPKARLVSGKI